MALDLQQVRLENLSDVRYSFWIGKHPGKRYPRDVLVIALKGRSASAAGAMLTPRS